MPRSRWLTPDPPGSGFVCRTLRIPDSEDFIAIVNGCLDLLSYSYNFEQFGSLTPEETADYFRAMFDDYGEARPCMIGAIIPYVLADPPPNTLDCDGSSYLRSDYPALYAALDTAFIVDADHFTVPDLRGRAPIGAGTGAGLTARSVGGSGGSERVTLSLSEIPSHTHSEITAVTTLINGGLEAPASAAIPSIGNTGSAGGDGSHDNMMPFAVVKYCIVAR